MANYANRQERRTTDRHTYLQIAKSYALRGQDLGQSKLNDDLIKEIRSAAVQREKLRQHIRDELSNDALAKRMGTTVRNIEKIVAYETWSHIG